MKKNKKKQLLFRISELIQKNKELTVHVKALTNEKNEIYKEKKRLENIIAQIPREHLPKGVQYLSNSQSLKFDMATVLYADLQDIKEIAQRDDSFALMDELDNIFLHFNQIVKKYKIEKIKTIGDAYMCAGGIPEKNITNPVDVVLAALEMQDYMMKLKEKYEGQEKEFWDFRIGIHTGPVTADLRGRKKPSYDLKGATVHIATRIASASEYGEVNVSIMTYELIKQYFNCDFNGKIPVKYKGNMEILRVKKIKPAYAVNKKIGRYPNQIFLNTYLLRQFTDLQEVILDKLEKELPSYLYYHNVKHTIDVVNQVELIGYGEGVDDEAILLLKTAALFHDAGHIITYDNHEFYSAQLAKEYLPKFKYNQEQIDKICELIMATKIPPKPNNLLEKIMCDADLDYLGRSDFIPVSNTLYNELKQQNKIGDINEWNKKQLQFIFHHQYFTHTALNLREINKQKQIERLKSLIDDS
ncbi:MAG: HD domain-containing protein [Bacteroidales bacterium]|nr:HD domain-containing protein [Bacteroidales bacterium]